MNEQILTPNLDMLRRRLVPYLRHARKAIVLGPVARGERATNGHLELVVVAETTRPFLERPTEFAPLFRLWPQLELLVYTPEEFEQMIDEESPFVEQVLTEGVVVHERDEG